MVDRPFDKSKTGKKKLERPSRRAKSWSGDELMDSGEALRHRVKEWEANLSQIEEDIDRLKILYDQFSIGVLKRVPVTERIRLERMLRAYALPRGAPARIKFRMTNLMQRYTILKTYWERLEREIEQGKFRQRFGNRASEQTSVAPPPRPVKKKVTPQSPTKTAKKKTSKKASMKTAKKKKKA